MVATKDFYNIFGMVGPFQGGGDPGLKSVSFSGGGDPASQLGLNGFCDIKVKNVALFSEDKTLNISGIAWF